MRPKLLTIEKTTKLDPRVKRTRKLLQQAFAELLAEKDFHSITVHDITERAEVNRATFYLHFEDKYALLGYSVREALQERLEKNLPDECSFTLANLRLLAVTVIEFMEHFFRHCHPGTRSDEHLFIVAQVQQHLYETLLGWLGGAGAKGNGQTTSAEHAAIALSWIIFGIAFQSALTDRKSPPEQLADQTLAFLEPSVQAYLGDPIVS